MNKKLFVGSVSYKTNDEALGELFSTCGRVKSAKILCDKVTGNSKGVAFVEMATEAEAKAAMEKLSGTMLGGRKIFVSEAIEKPNGGTGPGGVERRSGRGDRRKPARAPRSGPPKFGSKPAFGKKRDDRPGSFDRKKSFGKKKWEKRSPSDKPQMDSWERKPGDDKTRKKRVKGEKKFRGDVSRHKPWTKQPAGRFSKKKKKDD